MADLSYEQRTASQVSGGITAAILIGRLRCQDLLRSRTPANVSAQRPRNMAPLPSSMPFYHAQHSPAGLCVVGKPEGVQGGMTISAAKARPERAPKKQQGANSKHERALIDGDISCSFPQSARVSCCLERASETNAMDSISDDTVL